MPLRSAAFAVLFLTACGNRDDRPAAVARASFAGPPTVVPFRVPEMSEITDSGMMHSVLRGRAILEATRDSLPHNVGNSLRCVSCHFADGTARNALPWVGVYARYPRYDGRGGHMGTIEDRINDCFERSMNGHAIGASTSEMRDIVAYLAFLSLGVPVGARIEGQSVPKLEKIPGDSTRGRLLVAAQCSRCHGVSGEGSAIAPPLWGKNSFNTGAGMSNPAMFASFVHQLMPLDRPLTLSNQQAFDVAAYVTSRPRPVFTRGHDASPVPRALP